jgi:hypothetical protein
MKYFRKTGRREILKRMKGMKKMKGRPMYNKSGTQGFREREVVRDRYKMEIRDRVQQRRDANKLDEKEREGPERVWLVFGG